MDRILIGMAALLFASGSPAQPVDAQQNWFNDPFFPITAALPDCPLPAGPFTDEADRRVQAHRRLEKGTTCWLAKECDRPNAYAYDADIASAIQAAVRERNPFPDTTLWVTVQGRVVYIEGCARDEAEAARIETFVRALPHVQQATAILRTDPTTRPPYKTRPATLSR
ncbi:BON domain-containing protein [Rhizobacter sp. P5_C2]